MKNTRLLLFSFILSIPIIAYHLHHYSIGLSELEPTGFIIGDSPMYISNARQHIESSFSIFYSNPFSGSPDSPKIYSQPHNLLVAFFLFLGFTPGNIFSVFGIISAILCIFVSLKIITHLYPDLKYRKLTFTLLIWGGGLASILGIIIHLWYTHGTYSPEFWTDIFMLDPGKGWWALNFGRSLIIPYEAFYHLLFLTGILCLLKKRWLAAIIVSFFLSWSHPFTGIEYLLIICTWLSLERFFLKNRNIPVPVLISFSALFFLHLFYYLFLLNQFSEHKKIFAAYSLNWSHTYTSYLPAYMIVGILAIYTIYSQKKITAVFKQTHQRLFFLWAIIAFLLSKHEWFIRPIQPIHFARGYVWLGLFLFSIPGLSFFLLHIRKRKFTLILFILTFLSDNLLWYGSKFLFSEKKESFAYISKESSQVLSWFTKNTSTNDLLISEDIDISYLSNAYGSSYSWIGHPYNTPDFKLKSEQVSFFLKTGHSLPEWKGRRLLILVNKDHAQTSSISNSLKTYKVFSNKKYDIYTMQN